MNISDILLDILKRNGKLEIPEFGIFSLKNSRAKLNSANQSILPPAQKIIFSEHYQLENPSLFSNVAHFMKTNNEQAQFSLKTQTDFWKKKIAVGQDFEIQPFGKFIRENEQLVFEGNRVEVPSPDFYGLEEISLADIKDQKRHSEAKTPVQNYRFNQSVLWIFLLIIPVAGLIYLGITNSEYLFGKKTFKNISYEKATHRIEDNHKPKPQKIVIDSLKADSISTQNTTP